MEARSPASGGPVRAGRLITLEGPEGAGKTLQAERLAAALAADGRRVRLTREPGGTALGDAVRGLLLGPAADGRSAVADALLFNAARAQLVAEVVNPALASGEIVLCARFADSTLAYQGYGAGVPLELLRALEAVATGGVAPDLTILLDLPPEVGLARKADGDLTRFETDFDLAFHRRVRDGFLALAAAEPDRFVVIDATADAGAVAAQVIETTRRRL